METSTTLWKDRRRRLGLPLSFTRYRLSEDRIFCEKGFLNIVGEEVLLYRVRDLELRMSLWQRIFGVGTICVHSSDKTAPHLDLISVRHPREVKEMIFQAVEEAKEKRRMRTMEMVGAQDDPDSQDGSEEDFDEPEEE